ncbi:putative urea ABC transporter substrate-binding protein [Magnetospira sp. QH-2]|uniref:putative urea ABC transporter substrate-binding protein n=1 Tax=Magnetospira sp. (strain QH-2) TaxID=1288970 RepID=UPI0003E80E3A|nr:putative urea ABC transporter substrate-binding protein [Magnetospira sp. QH-2]CCQ74547.1 putative ABC transporter, substrate-binding protein [Magnetospira sp. QH-2]
MRRSFRNLMAGALCAVALVASSAQAAEKTSFKVMWSIYVGWMPWGYAADSGIVKKWADKYGIDIEVVQINDYIESINQYTAGAFDAGVMTNMDALTIPSVGGVDTTALIVGDFSNGNDGIVLKGGTSVKDLKGRSVNLVELSVSHYLLARGLDSVGLSEKDLTVVNTSDADIVAAYTGSDDVNAVVTWNPQLSEVAAHKGSTKVFDSSGIPGEIIDMLVVNTETLKANPKFAKALVGAWYETMAVMSADDAKGKAARTVMGQAAGTDLAGYEAQLATTKMFFDAADAVTFVKSSTLPQTMDYVAKFSFDHGLLGEGAPNAEVVGIQFPNGSVFGDHGNIKLRFDASYMTMAADGKL